MLDKGYMLPKIKSLLNIEDTDLYDDKLDILISGAIGKLEIEGVYNIFDEDDYASFNYLMCVSYLCAMDMDMDLDLNNLYAQYITRTVELRLLCNRLMR